MNKNKRKGFTLIEIIVVIACIALLAGILAPLVFKNIEDARIAKARSDIKAIAAGMTQFYSDVGSWPTWNDSGVADTIYLLFTTSDGVTLDNPPGAYVPAENQRDPMADHLINNNQNYPDWDADAGFGWNGSYLDFDGLDPWGNSYLISVVGFFEEENDPQTDFTEVWILSAGPDGTMQTYADESVISGDDIGIRIK